MNDSRIEYAIESINPINGREESIGEITYKIKLKFTDNTYSHAKDTWFYIYKGLRYQDDYIFRVDDSDPYPNNMQRVVCASERECADIIIKIYKKLLMVKVGERVTTIKHGRIDDLVREIEGYDNV